MGRSTAASHQVALRKRYETGVKKSDIEDKEGTRNEEGHAQRLPAVDQM